MQVKQNRTQWAGRRGKACGPARNGVQSIVELEPADGVSNDPSGIFVCASEFVVLDEAAEVAAAEVAAAEAEAAALQAPSAAEAENIGGFHCKGLYLR